MFDYINAQRKVFEKHAPYDGYPWQGSYTSAVTWDTRLAWSDELARKAEGEAARLSGGGLPRGRRFRHQLAGLYGDRVEELWLRGLDTEEYEVVGQSRPNTEPEGAWHSFNNGTMRLAVLYQTHSVKKHIGIAKACLASGDAWWVLLIGD
jgi:hypothetical protein